MIAYVYTLGTGKFWIEIVGRFPVINSRYSTPFAKQTTKAEIARSAEIDRDQVWCSDTFLKIGNMTNEASSRLNVLICAYGVDGKDVGEFQMAYKWVRHLSERVDVWLLTAGSRLHCTTGLETCPGVKIVKVKPKISFKRWDSFDRMLHPAYMEFFVRSARIAERVAKENDVHLCHHLAPFAFRYPSPLFFTSRPLVVGPISGGLKAPAVMSELSGKESWLVKLRTVDGFRMRLDPFLKTHYGRASKLIISAPYAKRELLLRDRHKSSVIISGIAVDNDSVAKRVTHRPDKFLRMISVSRIIASKGLELLILALARCRYKEKITLDIYGRGPLKKYYSELAVKIGVGNQLTWKGFAPNEKVLKAYASADIFALPSLKEPAGIGVIEAMAAGLPVLCVDSGGPAYTVDQNCGIKIPLTNKQQMVNDLAQAIDTLASDPNKRKAMGRNAQRRVRQEFTWDVVAERMLRVYKEVVSEAKRQQKHPIHLLWRRRLKVQRSRPY